MKLEVLKYPHPALLTKCTDWKFVATEEVVDGLETNMIETMLAENGIGLAANQVGILERFIAIQRQDNGQCLVMYNPQIVDTVEDSKVSGREGCLSFPRVFLEVARYPTVVVEYQDRHGEWFREQFNGLDARCIQHEIDHLDGIVFKSYVSDLKYQRALKKSK